MGKEKGTRAEMTYTFATEDYLGEFIVGTTSAGNSMAAQVLRHPATALTKLIHYPKAVGMFVKLCDSAGGRIDESGNISKPLDRDDRARLVSLARWFARSLSSH